MSWQNNKKNNNSIDSAKQDKTEALKSVSINSDSNKLSENVQFKALVDAAPSLTSAVASANGKVITMTFELSPSPILPAANPKFFDVKFDGISVPITSITRDYINFVNDVKVATVSSFSTTVVYSNGSSGIGATLTGPQEMLSIDGISLIHNDRILVKNYVGTQLAPRNGVYQVTTLGYTSATSWVMTRAADADSPSELSGMSVYVTQGTSANIGAWGLTTAGTIIVGTTSLNYAKIADDTAGNNYLINLSKPIKPNMDVTIDYFPFSTSYVTNNLSTSADPLLAFTNFAVDTTNLQYPYGFFDPTSWASSNYSGSIPNGILYERRVGFLTPPVVYDTEAPTGDVVLHQDKTQTINGMKIHYFGCYSTNNDTETSTNILAGSYYVQDVFENTVRESADLGGADDTSQYEIIGDGYNYFLVNYLNNSPTVKSIEFGLTATNPKNYVVEVKKTSTSSWTPLIYMYASSGTLEYFRYVFQTALALYAIRIRYRGDYYYQSNSALATVSGTDLLSGTEAIRLSHFSDYRDAQEFADTFPNSEKLDPQDEGWVAFNDGTTFYDWDIVNKNRIWDEFSIIDENEIGTKIFNFKNRLIAVLNNKIYSLDESGTPTLAYDASATVVNALAIHDNKLYAGLENGNVLSSSTGLSFGVVANLTGLPPVKCLQSFGRRLWIGTSLDSDGIGYVYNFNGISVARRAFPGYQVLCLSKNSTYLFLGLGSDLSGSQKGLVYYTDGITYTPAYNTLQDRVDAMNYNSGTNELWVGASDGSIFAFSFKTNGSIDSISRLKQLGAPIGFKFLSFVDAPDKEYFWLVTTRIDGNTLVYNVDYNIFYDTFKPGSVNINDVAYLNGTVYGVGSDGKVYTVDLNLFATDEKNVYLTVRDLAGNTNSTSIIDNIIYGLPSSTASTSEIVAGKIYQIKIPTTYYYQSTTTSDRYTYTTVKKWTSSDSILVYKSTSGGSLSLVSSGYTNLNNGSIIFATQQTVNDEIFITIITPSDGLLNLVNEYVTSSATSGLYAPSRTTRQIGIYESEPFYAPSLNRWNELTTQSQFATTAAPVEGEESGLQIDIYVRSANTRADCIEQDWGVPFTYSTINTTSAAGLVNEVYSIQAFRGKWLQFKVVMSSASINVTPKLNYVTLSYFNANDTYFFTKRFDTSTEFLDTPYPEIRRGLLTFNGSENGGVIQFKYLASDTLSDSFDISKYTDITPNSVFNLETPSRYIRFAILLVSAGNIIDPNTAAIVDEFAIQLDTGDKDLYWMNPDIPSV
jgi:hypothetical protein